MTGIKFGSKHSYDDFGLILTSKDIPLPDPKTEQVEIQNADGVLDLSTALTDGEIKYKNRSCTFTFTMIDPISNWESKKSAFANYIHGNVFNVILDSDPDHYYHGRCSINSYATDKSTATITVNLDADPYKYDVDETTEEQEITTSGSMTIACGRMAVVPKINVTADMVATFGTGSYSLTAGDNTNLNIRFTEGDNTITFTGSGTVTVTFRGGSL